MGPGETEGQQRPRAASRSERRSVVACLRCPRRVKSCAAGGLLVEIGDPRDLEIVAELLSADAVQIKAGAPVLIEGWGGPPLTGRVSRIDPAGFMKVSALGIEEQRVRTVIDLTDPPEAWSALGHDFRVVVRITVWSTDQALAILVGALFRQSETWAVFVPRTDGEGQARRDRPPQQSLRAGAGGAQRR